MKVKRPAWRVLLGDWPIEYAQLSAYNAERLRGILHDPKWVDYMAEVQERYNHEYGVKGAVVHSDGTVT